MNTKIRLGALLATGVVVGLLAAESGAGDGQRGEPAGSVPRAQAAVAVSLNHAAQGPDDLGLSPDTVQEAQEQLRGAGFDPGPATGAMDTPTREAIRKFQRVKGLPVSGELDEQTRDALRREPVLT